MEYYQSIWRYTEDTANELGRVLRGVHKGIKSYADYLVFDIDHKKDLQKAMDETLKLQSHLDFLEAEYETWFSGSKGFHLMVPSVQFNLEPTSKRSSLKNMAVKIAGDAGVKIDSSIYDGERRLRMPNSWNRSGKKYKIPVLDLSDTTMDKILNKANAQQENPYGECDDYVECQALIEVFRESLVEVKINRKRSPVDEVRTSKILVPWTDGKRNESCYHMARLLARRGIGPQEAQEFCAMWNDKQEDPLPHEEVKRTVKSSYTKGMNLLIDESNIGQSFYNAKKALRDVVMDIKTPKNGLVKTGYKFFDDYTGGLEKGDVVFWISRPGNFKTCILSNVLQRVAENTGKTAVFFSMEMAVKPLTKRHIQSAENLTRKQIADEVHAGNQFAKYTEKFKNVEIVNVSNLTIEQVIGFIDWFLEERGELGAIGFDYLSLFKGCASSTEATAKTATEIKTRIAKASSCPVFVLVQANRKYEGVKGNIELRRDGGKDSSSIEDSGDFIVGAWNHTENGEKKMYGKTMKGRRFDDELFDEEAYFEIDIDAPTMRVKSMEHIKYTPKFKQVREEQ
jgi:hypothetical protein